MLALVLNKNHDVLCTPNPLLQFDVEGDDRPIAALQRLFPNQRLSPWGQAWDPNNESRLHGLVFIVDDDWIASALTAHTDWGLQKISDCLQDDRAFGLYCDALLGGYRPPTRDFNVFHFGGTPHLASQLAHMVVTGRKRLTAGCLEACEKHGEAIPTPGLYSIVTDGFGAPQCLIETTGVDRFPFRNVPHEVAAGEGEGDLTFEYWRNEHLNYFQRECRDLGLEFTLDTTVFIEHFRLVRTFGTIQDLNTGA